MSQVIEIQKASSTIPPVSGILQIKNDFYKAYAPRNGKAIMLYYPSDRIEEALLMIPPIPSSSKASSVDGFLKLS